MLAAAEILGIDLALQPEFAWIAEAAAAAKTPPGWQEVQNASGNTLYVHSTMKLSQKDHPLLSKFKQFYESQLKFAKRRGFLKGNQRIVQIQETITRTIDTALVKLRNDTLPIDPSALEQVCECFNIDSTIHFHQVHSLKQALDIFVDRQFSVLSAIAVKVDHQGFIHAAREILVKSVISENFTEILLCQECQKKATRLKCEQCKDFFCNDCFSSTHAMGKRKAHETSVVAQTVCSICDCRAATMDLILDPTGSKLTCNPCYALLVSENRDVSNYPRRLLYELVCSECQHFKANIICKDCFDLFCFECHIKLHLRGKRLYHSVVTIDDRGSLWSDGKELPPSAVHSLIEECQERTSEECQWVKFEDGMWYNLATRATTRSISLYEIVF